jgi:hypothetical protein
MYSSPDPASLVVFSWDSVVKGPVHAVGNVCHTWLTESVALCHLQTYLTSVVEQVGLEGTGEIE